MPRLELRPFSDELLGDAGELLAARHRAHRRAEPLLPERYEDAGEAAREVESLWRAEDASGSVALRDGRVVGRVRDHDARAGEEGEARHARQSTESGVVEASLLRRHTSVTVGAARRGGDAAR